MKHDGKHNEVKMEASKNGKATVSAHTTFPTSGLYKLWAQFQRGGRVITASFVVRVAEGDKAETDKKEKGKENSSGAIKITVSNSGYEPSAIKVENGKPVKLAFYRKDKENCGDEIVLASLNIRKKLPVGQTVTVELTPKEAGEVTFACGMDMLRGKLIVQ
jgi:plastocyanin domain-containing protein